MSEWTSDELEKIGAAEELRIAPRRRDDLYVRSWRGSAGGWYRGAQVRREGHISAGGVEKYVTFVGEIDPGTNDHIDDVYRTKYRRYASYVRPMISSEARATTLKLVPRS